ncbi:MAG: hypothetical protein ACK4F0_08000 [Candidatus Ratteibacteria bacterium]
MKDIQKRKVRKIELIGGIGIIAFLVYIFLMQVISAKRCVRMAICAGNLKMIGLAIAVYSQDYNGYLLPFYSKFSDKYWFQLLQPYISDLEKNKIFICPSDKNHIWKGTNYVYNGHYQNKKILDFKHPEDSLLIIDGKPDISPFFTKTNYVLCIDFRHKHTTGPRFSISLRVNGNITHIKENVILKDNQFYGY